MFAEPRRAASRRCRRPRRSSARSDFVDRQTGPDGIFRLALQVWAEAMRDPALAEFVGTKYAQMRGHFVVLARRAQEAGKLPADADPEASARCSSA